MLSTEVVGTPDQPHPRRQRRVGTGHGASPPHQGRPPAANGRVVRQLVGYDRFEGERAYRQLAELYRAVLTVDDGWLVEERLGEAGGLRPLRVVPLADGMGDVVEAAGVASRDGGAGGGHWAVRGDSGGSGGERTLRGDRLLSVGRPC